MSMLILSDNGSYFKGLYVQWNKLKALVLKLIGWCALDINISIDNYSVLKLHQSQTLQSLVVQHFK